jgi:hypothetical protein
VSSAAVPEPGEGRVGAGGDGGSAGGRRTGRGGSDEGPDRLTRLWLALRDLLNPRKRNLIPYVSEPYAHGVARARAAAIRDWLDSRRGGAFFEPPFGDRPADVRFGESPRGITEAALRWQLAGPQLLLLGRAGDATIAALADRSLESGGFRQRVADLQPAVVVSPLPKLLARLRPGLFPWRAEVLTTRPGEIQALARFFSAVGIGVDVVKAGPLVANGECVARGGLAGTVAGAVGMNGGSAQVTCAHVLAPACRSVLWRSFSGAPGIDVTDQPDLALLKPRSCFQMPDAAPDIVECPSGEQLMALIKAASLVRRVGASGLSARGTAANIAGAYATGLGGMTRFPALGVAPRSTRLSRRLRFIRPPDFSQQGDSGSWVVEPERRLWLGVVCCAHEQIGGSYAQVAPALFDYLEAAWQPLERKGRTWLT